MGRENIFILTKWLEAELSASAFNKLRRITGYQKQANITSYLS